MKLTLKLLLVVCALALARVEAAAAAATCACAESPTVSKAKDRAEAVFVGTVVESHREMTAQGFEWRVRLRVEQTWKGATDDEIVIYTLGDCALTFETGKKYLVFARRQDGRGRLVTDTCMKTAPLDASADDVQRLGRSRERAAATAPPKETE
ncbi:MAG: hypothetical protein LC746_02120 [Acidobacteria bacterium]|nr:hypothetical protein [Acidobacteriota bacterium]